MPNPTVRVTVALVTVCPVNHAAFGVPFVFAAEGHQIAFAKSDDSRRQIDVVRDQQRLSRRKRHNKALMPAAVIVVREHSKNDALPFHLQVSRVLSKARANTSSLGLPVRKCWGRWRQGADDSQN